MKCIAVCLEHRFFNISGQLYTKISFPYEYWEDYLNYFDKIVIVARVKYEDVVLPEMLRVDGPNVEFVSLPYYVGPLQFFKFLPLLLWKLFMVSRKFGYFLLRSGNISNIIWIFLMINRKPYLREYPGNVREGIIGFAEIQYLTDFWLEAWITLLGFRVNFLAQIVLLAIIAGKSTRVISLVLYFLASKLLRKYRRKQSTNVKRIFLK